MNANDRAYFRHRMLQEQEAARLAKCPEARDRHEELAEAYRFRSLVEAGLNVPQAAPTAREASRAA